MTSQNITCHEDRTRQDREAGRQAGRQGARQGGWAGGGDRIHKRMSDTPCQARSLLIIAGAWISDLDFATSAFDLIVPLSCLCINIVHFVLRGYVRTLRALESSLGNLGTGRCE